MDDLDKLHDEYLALRERSHGAMLATLEDENRPAASYAPLVWLDGCAYLFLSELAAHTRNLLRCPSISLVLVEDESDARANAFARQRITASGEARPVAREDPRYAPALDAFRQRFGEVMALLESLPDFHLFALQLTTGRYIRGFGQAYELSGEGLDRLQHIDPSGR